MVTIGIDPGLTGYFATLNADGQYVSHWKTAVVEHVKKTKKRATGKVSTKTNTTLDLKAICDHLTDLKRQHGQLHAVIERQHVMPGQGLSSSGKTMLNFGIMLGLLQGLDIPTTVIGAKDWQAALLPPDATDTKAASVAAVQQWDASIDLRRTPRARTADHNAADAINIARHGHGLSEAKNPEKVRF